MRGIRLIRGYTNSLLHRVARGFGFYLIPRRKYKKGSSYEQLIPIANFAPWKTDDTFLRVFELVRNNTLVDKYRFYELWTLVKQVKHLNGAFLEVGVWKGGTGALIAKCAELCGVTEKVYLCDTFHGVVKAGLYDAHYKGGEHSDTKKQIVDDLIAKLHVRNVTILEGIFPDETGDLISDRQFRFCHIDVDAYESAKGIFEWVWPKMVTGGIVIFDDYGFDTCTGVTKFVNEEMFQEDRSMIYNLNGHAIIIKLR